MTYGWAGICRRLQTTMVTGTTSMMIVTLSRIGDAIAVISMNITIRRYGCPRDFFAAQTPRNSKIPVCFSTPTMIIIPISKKMTSQSMPTSCE